MITFTHEQFLLVILAGPTFAAMLLFFYVLGKRAVTNIVNSIRSHFSYKKRMREVIELKENGGNHEWITMAVAMKPAREALVCKITGYCPALNGFFDVKYVQGIAKAQEQAEVYNKYRNRRIADIALKNGIEFDIFMNIIEEVIAIPRDYTVGKLDDLQKELKGEKSE